MHPALIDVSGKFADHIEDPAEGQGSHTVLKQFAVNQFGLKLSFEGQELGYLGLNSSGWATLESSATEFSFYPHSDGKMYLKIESGTWKGYYLSVSKNYYVGAYGWNAACGWTLKNNELISDYAGASNPLSLYSQENGYLYCWDAYNHLTVVKS